MTNSNEINQRFEINMLIQLYRFGPTKQRIQKGFIVSESISNGEIKQTLSNLSLPFGEIRLDENRKRIFWIDTGMVWLHTARAREECFRQLNESVRKVSSALNRIGGMLIPSGVRSSDNFSWDDVLCGDRHFLKIDDPVEKEVASNLLRLHVPTIIAYSGKAGLRQNGLERIGSRRLLLSQEHYAARYLASLSPKHLERVKQGLRRDDGVSQLSYLDINPLGDPLSTETSIELRFIDSQALLSSVRAQAILIQALFIKARRLVRDGRRVGDPDQKYLERNRARAIAKAMQARFEKEPDRQDLRKNKTRHYRNEKQFVSVDAIWLELLESLQQEFQVLEVEYSEIAPLVLGSSLNQMGFAGLRNENDLYQAMSKAQNWNREDWLSQITPYSAESKGHQSSPLQSLNETRYPQPSQLVRRWWTLALRYDPKQKTRVKPYNHTPKPHPSPPDRANLNLASQQLAESIEKIGKQPTNAELITFLQNFRQTADTNEVSRGLSKIPYQNAQPVRNAFRSLKCQFKLYNLDDAWKDSGTRKATDCVQHHGISLLSFVVPQDQEARAQSVLDQLQKSKPDNLDIYIFSHWKFNEKRSGKKLLKIEMILTRSAENK